MVEIVGPSAVATLNLGGVGVIGLQMDVPSAVATLNLGGVRVAGNVPFDPGADVRHTACNHQVARNEHQHQHHDHASHMHAHRLLNKPLA